MSIMPYPTDREFITVQEIQQALADRNLLDLIVAIEGSSGFSINIDKTMRELVKVGSWLQLVDAGTKGHPSGLKITEIILNFQDVLRNSFIATAASIEASLASLQLHKRALEFAETNEPEKALECIKKCTENAKNMLRIFRNLQSQTQNVQDLSGQALHQMQTERNQRVSDEEKKSEIDAAKKLWKTNRTFSHVVLCWACMSNYCDRLTDIEGIEIAKNKQSIFIQNIKRSGLNWLILGKTFMTASINVLRDDLPLATAINRELVAYSDLPRTLDAIISEASNLNGQSVEQTIINCSKIRDMILAFIDISKNIRNKAEVKVSQIREMLLSCESEYSRNHQRLMMMPGLIQQKHSERETQRREYEEQMAAHDRTIRDVRDQLIPPDWRFIPLPLREQLVRDMSRELENKKSLTKRRYINIISSLENQQRKLIEEENTLKSRENTLQEKITLLNRKIVELQSVNTYFSKSLINIEFLSENVRLIESVARNSALEERQISNFIQKLEIAKRSLPASRTIQLILEE